MFWEDNFEMIFDRYRETFGEEVPIALIRDMDEVIVAIKTGKKIIEDWSGDENETVC